ncbi:MAG: hypothetical protein ACLQJ7_18370 [Syntrophobacteraceae bacterium]
MRLQVILDVGTLVGSLNGLDKYHDRTVAESKGRKRQRPLIYEADHLQGVFSSQGIGRDLLPRFLQGRQNTIEKQK